MIPEVEVELWWDDVSLAPGLPDPGEVASAGFSDGNWQFVAGYAWTDWEDAVAAIEVEAELVAAADAAAATPRAFDELLDGDLEDWQIEARVAWRSGSRGLCSR